MPKVRAGSGAKWSRRTQSATEEYTQGVQNPRSDWATATVAAAPVQHAAVQQAIADNRFAKGVQAAGSARWQQKAVSKGSVRFGPGVADAQGDYEKAVQPYLDVAANTVLPPRGPKGDPKNFQRVVVMANAMRNRKLGK